MIITLAEITGNIASAFGAKEAPDWAAVAKVLEGASP